MVVIRVWRGDGSMSSPGGVCGFWSQPVPACGSVIVFWPLVEQQWRSRPLAYVVQTSGRGAGQSFVRMDLPPNKHCRPIAIELSIALWYCGGWGVGHQDVASSCPAARRRSSWDTPARAIARRMPSIVPHGVLLPCLSIRAPRHLLKVSGRCAAQNLIICQRAAWSPNPARRVGAPLCAFQPALGAAPAANSRRLS